MVCFFFLINIIILTFDDVNMIEKKQKKTTRKQLYALNGLRGIASLGVVFFHMLESHFRSTPILGFCHHGYLLVDFFYLISGFSLGYSYDDYKDTLTSSKFLIKRFIKLEPMIIWSNFIHVIFFHYLYAPSINWVFDKIPVKNLLLLFVLSILNIPTPHSIKYRPDHVMFTLYAPQWSLFWEYIANFFYVFILRYLTTLSVYILTIISMIISVILIIYSENGSICEGFDVYDPYSALYGIFRTFTPFLIGYVIFRYKKEKDKKYIEKDNENEKYSEGINYSFEISSLILIITCCIPYIGEIKISKWKNALFEIIILFFVLPSILIIAINERKPNELKIKICEWLGKMSFYIYFTHFIFIDFLLVWVANNNYWFDYTWIMMIAIIILSMALANFVWNVYDAPIQKWLSSLLLK